MSAAITLVCLRCLGQCVEYSDVDCPVCLGEGRTREHRTPMPDPRTLEYSAERAEFPIRRRLTEAGCVSAAHSAWTLAHALRGWAPGRDAVGLVMSVADVDERTARAVVEGWGIGADEQVRALRYQADRLGRGCEESRRFDREAATLERHAEQLRAAAA